MAQNLKLFSLVSIIIVLLAVLGLAGCSQEAGSSVSTPAVEQPSSSSMPSSSAGTQSSSTSTQEQGNTSSSQQGSRGQAGQNMTQVLNKAADILGISESTFTSAFEAAQKSVFGNSSTENRTRGQRPSGGSAPSGQPPSSGSTPSGQPPTDNGTRGGQAGGSDIMAKVYAQMATTLNISADKISAAMQQAMQELGNQSSTTGQ